MFDTFLRGPTDDLADEPVVSWHWTRQSRSISFLTWDMMRAMRFNGNGKKGAVVSSCPSRMARSKRLAATIRGSLIVEGDCSSEKTTGVASVRGLFRAF